MPARRYLISGRVQGVFFRASTRDKASSLGLDGWVRNTEDGRVEVVASGDEERLGTLEEYLRQGPPMAEVEGVDAREAEPPGESGFRVVR